jgi:hypothetical protein
MPLRTWLYPVCMKEQITLTRADNTNSSKNKAYNIRMNYQEVIKEKVEDLSKLEKVTKYLKGRDRIRFFKIIEKRRNDFSKTSGKNDWFKNQTKPATV